MRAILPPKNPSEKNTKQYLSIEQLTHTASIVIEAFDIEMAKNLDGGAREKLISGFLQFYFNKDLFNFFVLANLKDTSETVYGSVLNRDFILNLTDRVSFLLTASEIDVDEVLIDTLVAGICRNKVPPASEYSLAVQEINQGLYVEPETLRMVLSQNFWLVVVYLLMMFFHETQTYKSSIEKL